MKRLLVLLMVFGFGVAEAQLIPAFKLTLVGTTVQDSLDKMVAAEDTLNQPGYVSRTAFAADTTYKKNQIAAKATLAQDTANVKLNRSELNVTFGTAAITVDDSIQVTLANFTIATGIVVASYVGVDANQYADTTVSVRKNTAGKFTLCGKNGSSILWWVPKL